MTSNTHELINIFQHLQNCLQMPVGAEDWDEIHNFLRRGAEMSLEIIEKLKEENEKLKEENEELKEGKKTSQEILNNYLYERDEYKMENKELKEELSAALLNSR